MTPHRTSLGPLLTGQHYCPSCGTPGPLSRSPGAQAHECACGAHWVIVAERDDSSSEVFGLLVLRERWTPVTVTAQ